MKFRAAIILDNLKISQWQQSALEQAKEYLDLKLILNCTNTSNQKKPLKHFFYYIINLISLRNRESRHNKFRTNYLQVIDFESIYRGSWQSIPDDVVESLSDLKIDVIVRFGMGLLTISEELSHYNILSFHHGNPAKYRGRPAGFYEIINKEKKCGIIVQKLSNKLDAGKILAFAECKVENYSYKKTSINLYNSSKPLLLKALRNLEKDNNIDIGVEGKIYTLPSNKIVIKFITILIKNFILRIFYGIFFEKKWEVSLHRLKLNCNQENIVDLSLGKKIPIKNDYSFYADPFFSCDENKIYLEALSKKEGIGKILEISSSNLHDQKIILEGGHYSYPFCFKFDHKEHILPEVASHSSPFFLSLNYENNQKFFIQGLEDLRIIDSTLFQSCGHFYLFFGIYGDRNSNLHLWSSNNIFNKFKPHPDSPISMNPSFSRMAGKIISDGNNLFRLGQNNEEKYGKSINILKITKLTPHEYSESLSGSIKMSDRLGPHTFNLDSKGNILIDHYKESFSLSAGLKRIKLKLARRN